MKYPTVRVIFDRKKEDTREKAVLVQLEILFEKRKKYISTGVKVTTDQWTDKSFVKNRADMLEQNEHINILYRDIQDYINTLQKNHEEFTFEKLDIYRESRINKDESFLLFMEERIGIRAVSESTKKRAMCVLKSLHEFGKIRLFSDITTANIKLWDDFAKKKCKKTASIYNYHKHLKTYIREALALDLVKKNPMIRLD
ncbi:phage integrase SAM-like domain-containing protein [Phocaeicola sp.]